MLDEDVEGSLSVCSHARIGGPLPFSLWERLGLADVLGFWSPGRQVSCALVPGTEMVKADHLPSQSRSERSFRLEFLTE